MDISKMSIVEIESQLYRCIMRIEAEKKNATILQNELNRKIEIAQKEVPAITKKEKGLK